MKKAKKLLEFDVAIALTNPKLARNVGGAVRAASAWGAEKVLWSGKRVDHPDEWNQKYRLPREERMKGYAHVEMIKTDKFFDKIPNGVTPIAIELLESSEMLYDFEHPDRALYVFGPEDGSLSGSILQHCHRFVTIPTCFCLNLAAAVNVVLSHRRQQMYLQGKIDIYSATDLLKENRGFISDSE